MKIDRERDMEKGNDRYMERDRERDKKIQGERY